MSETPISLYLDLEDGQVADLEVVSRAAIAFSAAIREAAFMIDPSLELKIGFVSGTEGSLSLNSLLSNFKNEKGEVLTLKALAFVIAAWFGHHVLDYTFDHVMDKLTDAGSETEFSETQKQELAEIVANAVDKKVAKQEVRRVYNEIEKDPAIKGVGVSHVPGKKPEIIIPRARFPTMLEAVLIRDVPEEKRRIWTERRRVVLVSPVLLAGTKRKWKFLTEDGEISAPIVDDAFLEDINNGKIRVTMRSGIELDVDLQTTEEFANGVWNIIDRKVIHVARTYPRPSPEGLPFAAKPNETDDDTD